MTTTLDKSEQNSIVRFLFDNHGVRGEIVRLTKPCSTMFAGGKYPKCARKMMQELAAATVLFAATLKDGSEIMVQLRGGDGSPIKYALINIREDLSFYGSCQFHDDVKIADNLSFAELIGKDAVLVLTIFPADDPKNKWQGIVAVNPESIAATLGNYFRDSQQLPTEFIIWSDTDKEVAAGIMLQVIPEIKGNQESLEHLSILANTMTEDEIFSLPLNDCLARLFAHEEVRVFPPRAPFFKCVCSRDRCVNALEALDTQVIESMIADGGTKMTCQHCGHTYKFSQDDLKKLLIRISQ